MTQAAAVSLRIKDVTYNQGVVAETDDERQAKLVAGRPTRVRVEVEATGESNQSVEVQLTLGTGEPIHQTIPFATLQSTKTTDFFVTQFPTTPGSLRVSATVDPKNELSGADSRKTLDATVSLTALRDLNVTFVPLTYAGDVPQTAVQFGMIDGRDYLSAIYPLPKSHLKFDQAMDAPAWRPYLPNVQPDIERDALRLWLQTELSGSDAERTVAIAPEEWFEKQPAVRNAIGAVFPEVPVAFIRLVGSRLEPIASHAAPPVVLAHELGHTYGFCEGYTSTWSGDPVPESDEALWVARPELNISVATDYMGNELPVGPNGFLPYPENGRITWTPKERFRDLFDEFASSTPSWWRPLRLRDCGSASTLLEFSADKLSSNATAPSIDGRTLLVTGLLRRGDGGGFTAIYSKESGRAFTPQDPAGDVEVRLLDGQSLPIVTARFKADFRLFAEPTVAVSQVPFVLALPDSGAALYVELLSNGKIITTTSVSSQRLIDALNALPPTAFYNQNRRGALLNQITAADQLIKKGNFVAAASVLENGVKAQIQSAIREYQPSSPLELTKTQLLALVDDGVQRLQVR